ncbi:MAG: acyl-CoA dehydrogenase family protein [Chloroflexi bacterium]|nr:acyl-CoA dehydrogenase family protein [Chloroflexota bacterium]
MPVGASVSREKTGAYHHTIITTSPAPAFDPLLAAAELAPLVRATADQADQTRRFPPEVITAMARARIFRQMVPRAAGGDELDPATALNVVECISRMDGSAGWLAMIGSGAGFLTGYVETDVARAMFEDPMASLCGNLGAATARAVRAPGGYRVTGRWPFVSGCEHATWLGGCAVVWDGEHQCFNADGTPRLRIVLFPHAEATIVDTWSATGLRASGSHDVAVSDIFVPDEYSLWWTDLPRQPGPLYPVRFMVITHAAHALGIARAALDGLVELAEHKQPTRSTGVLRELPQFQHNLAQAEALVHAARAFMWDVTAEVWDLLCADRPVEARHRALLRLAMTHAVQSASQAVDLVWAAAGASPVYTSSPLERCFRDIHVATQHAAVGVFSYATIGAALVHPEGPTLI